MLLPRFVLISIFGIFVTTVPGPAVLLHAAESGAPTFDTAVRPFLKKYCLSCHSGKDAAGELELQKVPPDFTANAAADAWTQVLQALQFDDMPPPEEDRPDPVAKADVIEWIERRMATSGRADVYRAKLLKPEYGNYVSHELLFSGTISTLPFSPSRLWRFSPQIFKGKGIRDAKSPFSYVTSESGVRDYSATSGVDRSTVEMILINTNQLLDLRTQDGDFTDFADIQETPTDDELTEVIRIEFRRAIGRLPSQQEQQKYLAFLKKNIADGGRMEGLKTTLKAMYLSSESIYRMELGLGSKDKHGRRHLSPDEISYAVAYALTDHNPERNDIIRQAVQSRKISTQADISVVVQEMLDAGMNPRRTPRIARFFEEFFGYNKADKVFKDMARVREEDIQQWNTNRLMYEAEQLVEYFINRDQNVIEQLLTSNQFYVAHPGNNQIAREYLEEALRPDYVEQKVMQRLDAFKRANRDPERQQEKEELDRIRRQAEERAKVTGWAIEDGLRPFPGWPYTQQIRGQSDLIYIGVYNLPPTSRVERQHWDWPVEQPFEMPPDQRAGMLTHPAWLAAHSVNDGNDPIRRGRWVQEKLLAGVIQDVPPDVDANVPNDPHKTLRERMEPLRAERCWRCHRKMNPLGEPFEIFDDWGRYRTNVYFDEEGEIVHRRGQQFEKWLAEGKVTERRIDATGEIQGSGDPQVDGKVTDAIDLLHRIGRSDRARQSFIRHLFRYFMGRNEMLSDSQTLVAAEKAYLDNSGSFKALVVSLLSSDSFVYRR